MKVLRPYQSGVIAETYNAWSQGVRCVLIVMPTGAGKTITLAKVVFDHQALGGKVLVQVHRSELIYQISMALADMGITHTFLAAQKDKHHCGNLHTMAYGRSYVDDMAKVCVTSVQSLNSEYKKHPTSLSFYLNGVSLCVPDEAHHVLKNNTFGTAYQLTPHARWMGVTATPCRTDKQGLGSMASNGIFEIMVLGPTMRQLINMGNLCEYEIYEPPIEAIDFSDVNITAGGDYNAKQMAAKMMKPTITGDAVKHYLELKPGRLMVTFCADIQHAMSVTEAYKASGVPSDVLHGGSDFGTRQRTLKAFSNRETLVLNTVDLVSEGFDLPAIEGAQMLKKSMSLQWYLQAFGRILRPMEGKGNAFLMDHVGNFREHGLPDKHHDWSLLDGKKHSAGDDEYANSIPLTTCRNKGCYTVYEITLPRCPKCGQKQPVSAERTGPLIVDGKLRMIPPEELAAMRGETDDIDDQHVVYRREAEQDLRLLAVDPEKYAAKLPPNHPGHANLRTSHMLWQVAQKILRPSMYEWLNYQYMAGVPKHAAQVLFERKFGVNVYAAHVLRPKEAHELSVRIADKLAELKAEKGVAHDTLRLP